MTYLPLRGLYLNLSARGSLVICPTQRDSYIFPCSIGVDFLHRFVENLSSECMEAFMVALISFSSYFRWIFVCALFLRF
jgi:hypothetical protein